MQGKSFYAIIPVRYASTRFPAKALADIGGRPLFWHAYKRAVDSGVFAGVHLACDDERIAEKAQEFDVQYIMTRQDHASGTDRVHEAVQRLNLPQEAIIANIQGDEPFVSKEMFLSLLKPFTNPQNRCEASTLGIILDRKTQKDRILSPNQVKIVLSNQGKALYFSRSPIPFDRENPLPIQSTAVQATVPYIGHIGVYAFTRKTLDAMTSFPPSPLEEMEKLEQLRLLENGISIDVTLVESAPHGIDTPEDYEKALQYYAEHKEFWV